MSARQHFTLHVNFCSPRLSEKYSTIMKVLKETKPKKFILICLVDGVKSSSPMLFIFCWVYLVEMLRNELYHAVWLTWV